MIQLGGREDIGSHVAFAQAPSDAALLQKLTFALQCNASLGTIENVRILMSERHNEMYDVVRGSYTQILAGNFRAFGFSSADSASGVFEAAIERSTGRIRELQFKISVRGGAVKEICLR